MRTALPALLLVGLAVAAAGCASSGRPSAVASPPSAAASTPAAQPPLKGCRPAGTASADLRVTLSLPAQVERSGTTGTATVTNTGDAAVVLSPSAAALPVDDAGLSLVTETGSTAVGSPVRLEPGQARELPAALSLAACDATPAPGATSLPELPNGRYQVVAQVLTEQGEAVVSAPVTVQVGSGSS